MGFPIEFHEFTNFKTVFLQMTILIKFTMYFPRPSYIYIYTYRLGLGLGLGLDKIFLSPIYVSFSGLSSCDRGKDRKESSTFFCSCEWSTIIVYMSDYIYIWLLSWDYRNQSRTCPHDDDHRSCWRGHTVTHCRPKSLNSCWHRHRLGAVPRDYRRTIT